LRADIDPAIKEIASIFKNMGKELYLVGGAVRDILRGKKIHDWDLATDALPEEVTSIMRRHGCSVIPTGIKHGTVTVIYKKNSSNPVSAEITTFRTESGYSDGRRPDDVRYASSIYEDLSRRDFTMNAIALRLLPGNEIVDPFNGAKDINAKIIRCAGNPAERFNEDGLRPMRAVRFAAQLGFKIDKDTLEAIPGALDVSAKVSKERIRDEIDKILFSPVPSHAFYLMEKTGLLSLFLNELALCRNVEQKGFHQFDVLDHCLLACDYAAAKDYSHEVRLASLFHDVGKPNVRSLDESGVYTFYRHEEVSANMSRAVLSRLRYSNAVIDKTCHLIKEHMFQYTDEWSDSAVRRFIARVKEEHLPDIYCLRRADIYGFAGKEPCYKPTAALMERVKTVLADSRAFTIKNLAITGRDLMTIGIQSGKVMGIILKELLETVLDDPQQNTREKLLEIAKKMHGNMN